MKSTLSEYAAGYAGRAVLGLGFALICAAVGVILGRMGLLLFGVTSWFGWLSFLLGGIGVGAGLGSVMAWLWLKGLGAGFSIFLALAAVAAGVGGAWLAFRYGTGVEPECCASPDLGPIAYSILGAVLFANATALVCGSVAQTATRLLRHRRNDIGSPRPQAH